MQIFAQPISGHRVQMKEWTLKNSMSIIHFCEGFLVWSGFWKEQEVIAEGVGSILKTFIVLSTCLSTSQGSHSFALSWGDGRVPSVVTQHHPEVRKNLLKGWICRSSSSAGKSVFIHYFIIFFFQSYSSTRWVTVTKSSMATANPLKTCFLSAERISVQFQ